MSKERSLFEYEFRMKKLSKIGDPLLKLNKQIPWEKLFMKILEKTLKSSSKEKGGRPSYDSILMFKILILQRFYNLSDEQMEYQLNDRLSFQRFLELTISDDIPDFTTIWRFREHLIQKKMIKPLFKKFNNYLSQQGLIVEEGIIVDASFVDVPRQRNSREENKEIKSGKTPSDWSHPDNKHKLSQKDVDARWTKKGGEVHYGYKNHIKVDKKNKIIKDYEVTSAEIHDSQVVKKLFGRHDKKQELYADSAYKSKEIDEYLTKLSIVNKIHEKGYRDKPLTEQQKKSNKKKSKIRAKVEHVFGFIENSMGGSFIRNIGQTRATAVIGLMNLTYNLFRFEQLTRASA